MPKLPKDDKPEGTKFVSVTIRDQVVDFYVSKTGEFNAVYDGAKYEAKSKEDLERKLFNATKQKAAKIAIPFVRAGVDRWSKKITVKHGVVTGKHSSNGNLLIKWDGEKGIDQEHVYQEEPKTEFLRVTPAQEKELAAMYKDKEIIDKRIDLFEKAHAINILAEVRKAVTKAGAEDDA